MLATVLVLSLDIARLLNRYNVYLHDTPAKELFDRPFRAFSHGCIRLERPLDLALVLLRDQPQWSAASIESAIAAGAERSIRLTMPQPVSSSTGRRGSATTATSSFTAIITNATLLSRPLWSERTRAD